MNNVFNFATSELSQDALLCYWFNFASEKYFNESINERESAQKLLSLIIKEWTGDNINFEDIRVNKIVKQFNKIDVLILVNDKYFILIEDKIYTSEHNKQISKYIDSLLNPNEKTKVHLVNKFKKIPQGDEQVIPVYFKMIEQSSYELDRYCLINRKKVLEIITQYNFANLSIMEMFKNYLLNIENEYNNYYDSPVTGWTYNNYYGFFSSLHNNSDYLSYIGYLNNYGGGFFANWFNFNPVNIDGATDIFIMISGPKKGYTDFVLEYRISYKPLEIDDIIEKKLFKNIEKIRHIICSSLDNFDRASCPKQIPLSHKKIKKSDYIIEKESKEKILTTDRNESVRLAKLKIRQSDIFNLQRIINDSNLLINEITSIF